MDGRPDGPNRRSFTRVFETSVNVRTPETEKLSSEASSPSAATTTTTRQFPFMQLDPPDYSRLQALVNTSLETVLQPEPPLVPSWRGVISSFSEGGSVRVKRTNGLKSPLDQQHPGGSGRLYVIFKLRTEAAGALGGLLMLHLTESLFRYEAPPPHTLFLAARGVLNSVSD